jgi:hypothetical protein
MYQKDFILRMIEMLGEFINAILGLIRKGDFQKADQLIDKMYFDLLKQDAAFFRAIPKDELTAKLIKEHNYTNGHLQILAELFYAEAEVQYAKGSKAVSAGFYEKALHLFEFLEIETKTFSLEHQDRIKAMQSRLLELQA